MATTPPPAVLLGQLLLHALEAGASSRTLGEFARLQCAAQPALDPAALGVALAHLAEAGADATVLGRFAVLNFSGGAGLVQKPVSGEEVPASVRELVREEVRAEFMRGTGGTGARKPTRKGTILKLTLPTGRTTSLSLPKDLVEAYRAALGQASLTALLKSRAGGDVPVGSTRSHLARTALEEVLQAHRAAQASRSPLTLVAR